MFCTLPGDHCKFIVNILYVLVLIICIFFTVPLKLPRTYRRYNTDIECPSFSPQTQSTPNSNYLKNHKPPLMKNALPVNHANKVLFHYENEKLTSQKDIKLAALVEKEKPDKNEEVKIQIDEVACIGKYWNKITTIAQVHNIPEDIESAQYINVPNNAKELGVSQEMLKVLGNEVDEIMSESDSDSNPGTAKPYLYIKSKEEYTNDESLIEAILFSSSNERFCI